MTKYSLVNVDTETVVPQHGETALTFSSLARVDIDATTAIHAASVGHEHPPFKIFEVGDSNVGSGPIVTTSDPVYSVGAQTVTVTRTSSYPSLELFKEQRCDEVDTLRDVKKCLPILSEGYQIDPDTPRTGAMAVEKYSYSKTSKSVASITRDGNEATVTTDKNHHLKDGVTITPSGADQGDYNISADITWTGKKTFTYTVSGTPATPATGTIVFTIDTYKWITADDQTIFLTADEFDEVFHAATEYSGMCQLRGRELKDAIDDAADVAAVLAIDITTGWPDTGL